MVQIRFSTSPTSIKVGQPLPASPAHNDPPPTSPPPIIFPENGHINIRINPRPQHAPPPAPIEPVAPDAPGVSVLVCTNRPEFMERVLANFSRQNYSNKELVVVLNKNSMQPADWYARTAGYSNIRILQQDEHRSLGECLNAGIEQCSYDYVAKFDDDDYYGPHYLQRQMQAMLSANADIVGKATWYLYFERSSTLALFSRHPENAFVNYVTGATLLIKKEIFNSIRFSAMNVGEDVDFVAECKEHGFRIYSTDRSDFVGIRRPLTSSHTWQEADEHILNQCQIVAHTDNYLNWANA